MITNAPTHAYPAGAGSLAIDDRPGGFVAWFLGWMQRTVCALRGHDPMLQYERNRIFLRCTSCGHETPGWEVAQNAMPRHHATEARVARAAPADLAVMRRIA